MFGQNSYNGTVLEALTHRKNQRLNGQDGKDPVDGTETVPLIDKEGPLADQDPFFCNTVSMLTRPSREGMM